MSYVPRVELRWFEGTRYWSYSRSASTKPIARVWLPGKRPGEKVEKFIASVRDSRTWHTANFDTLQDAKDFVETVANS